MDILGLLYETAVDSFFKVGVFAAITLLLIGFIDFKLNGIILKFLEKDPKNQIYFAAILGLVPGCGGAIVIVPMYILGKVSFGSLVTAFITTMGDAAFVLIVGKPEIYFKVLIISGVVGILTGLIIDKFKIGDKIILNKMKPLKEEKEGYVNEVKSECHKHIAHEEGDIIDKVLHRKETSEKVYLITHKVWYKIFWFLVIIALPFALEHLIDGHSHDSHDHENIFEVIGVIGTVLCIIYCIISRKRTKGSDFDKAESKLNSVKETFIHTADEVAFLVTWVFIAFLSYELLVRFIGGVDQFNLLLNQGGFLVVVAAVLIGLVPGCGPQILLAGLYIAGGIPFSALMANAICNDGDALFPLLALSKKSAFLVTIYNVIPALIVGGVLYFFGI